MRGRPNILTMFSKGKWIALLVFTLIALMHNFIANDKYILAYSSNGLVMFSKPQETSWGIKAPIPYAPKTLDRQNRGVGPFSKQEYSSLYYRHWLGTDSLGRDVLAGVVNGTYIAFVVGIGVLILSFIIGLFLSYLSGYLGDTELRVDRLYLYGLIPLTMIIVFYIVYSDVVLSLFLLVVLLALWGFAVRQSHVSRRKSISLPLDIIIFRIIEVFNSVPGLFLILIMLALFEKASIWNVVLVLAVLKWPVITRHLRAEILKLKREDYINSAKAIGLPDWRIFIYHILPMAISPVIIVLAFGFSSTILMESTLSFLGIGVPVDEPTWGSTIRMARQDFKLWWLAVFPGLAIYSVVVLFNNIGSEMNDYLRGQNN